MKMRPMIYKQECSRTPVTLYKGTYKGRKFCILNLGTHPTAYVSLMNVEAAVSRNYDDYYIKVNGGATFLDKSYWDDTTDLYIGWDYAHYGDYSPYFDGLGSNIAGKKWTTEEIFEEVKSAIDQLNNGDVIIVDK